MATEILQRIRGWWNKESAAEVYAAGDSKGGAYTSPLHSGKRAMTELGQRFCITNPTPGTPIARVLNAAFADTIAMFVIQNKGPKGGPNIYIDTLRLLLATAPATTTAMQFATFVDENSAFPIVKANALYYNPVALNAAPYGQPPGSVAIVAGFPASASVMTIPAGLGGRRQVGRFSVPTSLGITGDEYLIQFGAQDHSVIPGLTAVRATAAARLVTQAEELCIAPGEFGIINQWWLTETAGPPTYEFELAWTEKQP